jgi:glycosyltransferase involved in cell wall biosynthesis
MRIALLSTCAIAVPPKGYGGTELVAAELAGALVSLGHDVTVFATGDSRPAGELRFRFAAPVWPPDDLAELRHAAFAFSHVAAEAARGRPYDVVHAHQAPAIAFGVMDATPLVLTIHHDRDASLTDFYADFPEVTFVGISRRQASRLPELHVRHVVHHGLDPARYAPGRGEGGFVAFLGRLSEQKGPHAAIDAAVQARLEIRLAGRPHWNDREYYEGQVLPRIAASDGLAREIGEVAHDAKLELLRGARATVFPIDWEEPFGLVMIESMLVGTPVIAFRRGSVPEIVEEGITGFVVDDAAEMSARLRSLERFDRERCRARAVERWNSTRMARDYVRIYEEISRRPRRAAGSTTRALSTGPSRLPPSEPPDEIDLPTRPSGDIYERASGA